VSRRSHNLGKLNKSFAVLVDCGSQLLLLTSRVQRLVGLSTRNRRRIPSQSVDM